MPLLQRKRYLNLNHAGVYAPAPGGAAYVGPGDIVSGAFAWYGLRGYTAAYATGSNPALDLVDQAGANQLTVNILSNGRLDVASISAWVTANSVSTIKVKKAYDQTGNARHLNQATLGNMPVLNLTGLGSLPAIEFTAASNHNLASGNVTLAQPITWSVVFNKSANNGDMFASGSGSLGVLRFGSNGIRMLATTPLDVTASDNAAHAGQFIFNGASSAGYIDGSNTTGDAGTGGFSATTIIISPVLFAARWTGSMAELGIWGSAFTTGGGGQASLMNTNQHGTDGHNF